MNWYEDELLIDGKFALDEKSLATPKLVPGCRQLFSGLSSIDVAIINEYFFLVTIINEEEVPLTTPNNLLDAYIGTFSDSYSRIDIPLSYN